MSDWILDLCSGLGGASQAFAEDPYWEVVRIENNVILSGVPHTRLLDVNQWIDWLPALIVEMGCRPTIIWASPPCLEFSTAFRAPGPVFEREHGIALDPDMTLVESVIDIIEFCRPRYHVIENVAGAVPHFFPELGSWSQKLGPYFLWGQFPRIDVKSWLPNKNEKNGGQWGDPLRANIRALVPIEISHGFLQAICSQSKLSDWI